MAGYWLKLYTEILDDPKYHRLSEQAKLGMIELMMVAKKHDKDGCLPSLDDICFYTRRDTDWWNKVIDELEKIFYVIKDDSGERIRKFAERQQAVDPKERKKQARAKKQREEYRDETSQHTGRKVSENRDREEIDKDKEGEKENNRVSPVQSMIESIIGIPPANAADTKALDEITALNPTKEDIKAAYSWLQGIGKQVRYYSSLVGPIRTAMSKRMQKPNNILDKNKIAVMKVLEESEAE